MGIAGFQSRDFADDDPLVCSCAATIGTQALTKNEHRLEAVIAAHALEHQRRLAHQAAHRRLSGECPECL